MLILPADDGKDTRGARDIISVDTFDLFDLTWEWKIAEGGNSGLKYFVLEDRDSAIGHEYQMIDDARHPDAKIGPHRQTAAFYDVLAAGSGTFTQQSRLPGFAPSSRQVNGTTAGSGSRQAASFPAARGSITI